MRKRIINVQQFNSNKAIRVLSELFEISFNVVKCYYFRYKECIKTTKFHLSQIARVSNELEFINDVNLCY